MANRQALRELQSRLAERMQAARERVPVQSWLAVESAGRGLLFPLAQAGEIFQLGPVLPVPHTHGWFLGVANLRGNLHGVIDLAAFFGIRRAAGTGREQARLVAFNAALEVNGALLVDRLAGLRSADQITLEPSRAANAPGFVGSRYRDADGRAWQEVNLSALARDEHFLRIVG